MADVVKFAARSFEIVMDQIDNVLGVVYGGVCVVKDGEQECGGNEELEMSVRGEIKSRADFVSNGGCARALPIKSWPPRPRIESCLLFSCFRKYNRESTTVQKRE